MTVPYGQTSIPLSDNITLVVGPDDPLPGELTETQKAIIKMQQNELRQSKLGGYKKALEIVETQIKRFSESKNQNKLRIYQSKKEQLEHDIREIEQLLLLDKRRGG